MICIPITSGTNKEALRAIERSCRFADLIELRMDLIGKGNLAQLISAVRDESISIKIIVTCRKKEEAAPVPAARRIKSVAGNTIDKKMTLLKKAIELGVDFVDIELAEGRGAIKVLTSLCAKYGGKTGIIISYHNIKETPALTKIKEIFHKCTQSKPAVIKIVTMAKTFEDNLTTLSLIPYARKHSQKIISLCMGNKGSISRAVAPMMGNYLSFATLGRQRQSALGQFTVGEMKQIDELFKSERTAPLAPVLSLPKNSPQNYILLGNPIILCFRFCHTKGGS